MCICKYVNIVNVNRLGINSHRQCFTETIEQCRREKEHRVRRKTQTMS